MPLDH